MCVGGTCAWWKQILNHSLRQANGVTILVFLWVKFQESIKQYRDSNSYIDTSHLHQISKNTLATCSLLDCFKNKKKMFGVKSSLNTSQLEAERWA